MNLRPLLTGLVVLLFAGCGQPKISPVKLSVAEAQNLDQELAALDTVLAQHSPQVAGKLNPAASAGDIALLRQELDGVIVQPLEGWFLWHNGTGKQTAPLLPAGYPVTVRDAIEDRKLMRETPLIPKERKSAIKILEDGAGDGMFIDLVGRQTRVFYHMLEDPDSFRDFGRLDEFVAFIRQVHEARIIMERPGGWIEFDEKKYQALEKAYLQRKSPPPG